MNDVDHYYLPRSDQDKLVAILGTIPGLVEDLSVSLTRQDRITTGGPRIRSGHDEQPLPIGLAAMEAADELHDELVRWVREVCDQRVYPYPGNDTLTLARWLRRNIIALGLTEGADEALHDIGLVVKNARMAVDRPQERVRAVNMQDVRDAAGAWLSAQQIANIAPQLDAKYHRLNLKRVLTLVKAKQVTAIGHVAGCDVYCLGDVLSAHLAYPSRKKKAA